MLTAREAPAEFVRELRRRFGSDWTVRWNDAVSRWEFISHSAAGTPVSQFWGWYRDPVTGQSLGDSDGGHLVPFRDLQTPEDQAAVFDALERSFTFNRADGFGSWRERLSAAVAHNRDLRRASAVKRGQQYAELITEMDLRRPWVKFHKRGRPIHFTK